jgi:hypothetical protein
VTSVGDRRGQRIAEQWRDLDPLGLAGEAGPDLVAEPFGIERFEQFGQKAGGAFADAALAAEARLGEEIACGPREVQIAHAPRDNRGSKEVVAQEACHRIGDAVLVGRDDRGVRDRDSERMAKQRGHREPVGQAADHRRFGEGNQVAPGWVAVVELQRGDEHRRHEHQQPGRGAAHPAGAVDARRRRRGDRHRAPKRRQLRRGALRRARLLTRRDKAPPCRHGHRPAGR